MRQTILFQHNSLAALMAGLYQGTMSLNHLLEHGDLGIGTLDQIDGELIILDGQAYQARGTGGKVEVLALDKKARVPYAAVARHRADQRFSLDQALSDAELKEWLESKFTSYNLFHSIKIKGQFKDMHVRMIPKSPLGKSFAEIAQSQPEFTREEVSGTLLGFWTPELFHGVSVAGYHLHFLSDDKQFGGHVLDFQLLNGQAEIGQIDGLFQDFPVNSQAFREADFDVEQLRKDIDQSE
ncbi:acetolactate decarboxylase [Streptococcus pseudoporcinus]|uniref:Alpha-acetolactate decarboxylase n=1 Tax=Streptococcus pseudoporcinus LQ 940-04 TaxID=875093 RepID=G5KAS7_9STRE|nr:acetolactate decarboxylase [Streptococcus pseudoporcinus]EFR44656.1 alpha-acetolactate decarboxylase [Streptococcus pseudoporcinus SPIN 20026]EHI65545.1 alpha-acetolactate decarboxylase [Streptococcus pseudoporcinus LQ 940-04]VEF93157.1 alpha-acetolactate decarboxylase [Streptococcus pseudoporcinus]